MAFQDKKIAEINVISNRDSFNIGNCWLFRL
jgi:hypothetical protein